MLAAVDVGTNTIRLLIGEAAGGKVRPHRYYRRIARLGGGFSEAAELTVDAQERALSALHEVKQIIASEKVSQVRVVGTEILRRAVNAGGFLKRVRQETSLPLMVIEGDEEARLSSTGVLSALDPEPESCLIFDLGGGSTEFTLTQQKRVVFHQSYRLGVVALAENIPQPPDQLTAIDSVLDQVAADLAAAGLWDDVISGRVRLIGTAGTVTTLAAMHLQMCHYDWRRVNNLALLLTDLRQIKQQLLQLSVSQRESLPGMEKGRGDLILPGLHVVLQLMNRFGKDCLVVSDFGLLEGVLLSLASGRKD